MSERFESGREPNSIQMCDNVYANHVLKGKDLEQKVMAVVHSTALRGYVCNATNAWIAEELLSSPDSVANAIGRLVKMGYLERETVIIGPGRAWQRVLRVTDQPEIDYRAQIAATDGGE